MIYYNFPGVILKNVSSNKTLPIAFKVILTSNQPMGMCTSSFSNFDFLEFTLLSERTPIDT